MDPEQALANARKALAVIRKIQDADLTYENQSAVAEAGQELADAFEALDGWLSAGGFLPTGWLR